LDHGPGLNSASDLKKLVIRLDTPYVTQVKTDIGQRIVAGRYVP